MKKIDLDSTQRFELEIGGVRTPTPRSTIFEALNSGRLGPSARVWIGGYEGRVADIDERVVDGKTYLFLKNTPLEKIVVARFLGLEDKEEERPFVKAPISRRADRPKRDARDLARSVETLREIENAAKEDEPLTPIDEPDEIPVWTPGDENGSDNTWVLGLVWGAFAVLALAALGVIWYFAAADRDGSNEPDADPAAQVGAIEETHDRVEKSEPREKVPLVPAFDDFNDPLESLESQDEEKDAEDAEGAENPEDAEDVENPENAESDLSQESEEPSGGEQEKNADADLAEAPSDSDGAEASKPRSGEQSPTVRKFPTEFAVGAFTCADGLAPTKTRGNDVAVLDERLYDALHVDRASFVSDKEYETAVDKQRRNVMKTYLSGTIKIGSYVSVCLPPKNAVEDDPIVRLKTEYVTTKYDANARTLTLMGKASSTDLNYLVGRVGADPFVYSGIFQKLCEVDLLDQNSSAVWHDFAYGVIYKAALTQSAYREAALKNEAYATQPPEAAEIWKIKDVDSTFVKEYADYLAVCCVGRLELPDKILARQLEKARDYRYPKKATYAVYLGDVEFWIYDYRDGKVVAKFTANEVRRGVIKRLGDLSSGKKRFESGKRGALDWPTLFAQSKDAVDKWEIAPPDIAVPQDAPTLVDALKLAKDGDTIQVSSSDKPVPFGEVKRTAEDDGYRLDKSVSIVGATGNPDDAVVEFGSKQYLTISSNVCFKGVTFLRANERREKNLKPLVQVAEGASTFKFCIFDGGGHESSIGVEAAKGTANFWKCAFCQFRDAGLLVHDGGKSYAAYCEIGFDNANGVCVLSKGKITLKRSLLYGNERAFVAKEGGGGKVEECFFEGNEHPWAVSSGSSRAVEKIDVVVD